MEDEQVIRRISLREYIIDFFGSLMPGLIAVFLITIGFIVPMLWYIAELEEIIFDSSKWYTLCEKIIHFISAANFAILIFFFILYVIISFTAGVIYNRRDIKMPDRNSYIRTIMSFEDVDDMDNWIVNPDGLKEELVKNREKYKKYLFRKTVGLYNHEYNFLKKKVSIKDVQFPYTGLPKYLQVRGYDELAKRIPWYIDENIDNVGKTKDQISDHRSKTFINMLKNRIYLKSPENYNFIIKHEGEIRMSATLWHLSKTVKSLSLLSVFICILVIPLTSILREFDPLLIAPLLLSFMAVYVAWRTKISIEGFLHYQRVREIFYVLTTAQAVSIRPFELFDFSLFEKDPVVEVSRNKKGI